MTQTRLMDDSSRQAIQDLQNRAKSVIEPLIPPDAEERVQRSLKQWNQIVREHIRNETGLRLADGDGRNTIQVKVVDGFPILLARLIDRHRDPVLWRIILGQTKLGGVIEGLQFLLHDWPAFEAWNKLPPVAKEAGPHLEQTLEVAKALQRLAVAEEVRKQIQQIDEDILGVYRFPSGMASQVELYWMPIAMVAAMLNQRIEDLTVVVLAHELTHGYTHIGRDIDGTQWNDLGFAKSDLNIVEGLAQFYTEVVTSRLSWRTPGPQLAYQALLKMQSGPYLAHQSWAKDDSNKRDDPNRGEAVRFSMIAIRRQGAAEIKVWDELLKNARTNLRAGKRTPKKDNLFDEGGDDLD